MVLYSLLDCYDKPSLSGDETSSSNEEIGSYPYSLHLGSHNNLAMAKRSILDLKAKGIQTYLSRVDLGDKGIWFRIFTGHFKNMDEAERFKQEHALAANIKNTPYANLIGTYSNQDDLKKEIMSLKESGYFPYTITYDDGRPRLFVGAFLTRAGAKKQYHHLKSRGIHNKIVTR
jgi:cell division septation protein DedD